jgi:hypothetical protein
VTGFTAITDAVKPVGEDDGPYTTFVRKIIEDNIAVFRQCLMTKAYGKYTQTNQADCQRGWPPKYFAHIPTLRTA